MIIRNNFIFNSFSNKILNVLLLLFVISSCGMSFVESFGMNPQQDNESNLDPTNTEDFSVAPRNIYLGVPYLINKISKQFVDVTKRTNNKIIVFFFFT